jgi:D-arginine dehydrogenase
MAHASGVRSVDVVVIGAGMAGVSIGYELAADASVLVLEQEDVLAKHTTGRSAAAFLESYGGPVVRALTRASRVAYDAAPTELGTPPLLSPRPLLMVGRTDQEASLTRLLAETAGALERVTCADAIGLCPGLDPSYLAAAAVDATAMDIDVMGLHQGYVAGIARRGGVIRRSQRVLGMHVDSDGCRVQTAGEDFSCGTVVNAAGAWADEVSVTAGLRPIGLQPRRRTIAICSGTRDDDVAPWPLVVDADERFYFKPEAGRDLLVSPGDTTPVPAHDARPQEEDIAMGIDRVNTATTLGLRHVRTAWAGLRTFAIDSNPVVGDDPRAPGFFWFAGQGGYGIQMAPALARVGAALIRGESTESVAPEVPADALSVVRLFDRNES